MDAELKSVADDREFPRTSAVTVQAPDAQRLPPQALRSAVTEADWDELFGAVKDRLKLIVAPRLATRTGAQPREEEGDEVQVGVMQCVAALDQLHAMVSHERRTRHLLEQEVSSAQAALAQAVADLVGTQAEEALASQMARHDPLTALPNRATFRERLDELLVEAGTMPQRQTLAVLYLDLDGFKQVNDRYGHDAGDEVLRIVAARLVRAVRAEDMVGRLGGDEFACMLAEVPSRELLSHVACKLLDAVAAPLKIGAHEISISPSIGIAICPADGASTETLIRSADSAMYCAKRRRLGYAFSDCCGATGG